ncbi:MAG: hypothetical protein ABJK43_08745 [Lentilitoribacter sp.]
MQPVIRTLALGLVALSSLSSCSHVQRNLKSFQSKICNDPDAVSNGKYDVKFDLVSSSHGYAIYFESCPEKYFSVDMSKIIPRDQLHSDIARAAYRNVQDPNFVLRINGLVDYKFLKKDDFIGGEFTVLSIESWRKADNLSLE